MNTAHPLLTNLFCILGIVLVLGVSLWPILGKRFARRPKQSPDPATDQRELDAQARALTIALLPYAARVRAIHDLILNQQP